MKKLIREFTLTDENIVELRDACSEEYEKLAGKRGTPELRTRLELAVEEYLGRARDVYGEGASCKMYVAKLVGQLRFELRYTGEAKNMLSAPSAEDDFSYRILSRLGQAPEYTYNARIRTNIITFAAPLLPVRNRVLKEMVLAVALAVATALLIKVFPGPVADFVLDGIITPVFNKTTAVITAIATPLVFLGVITGLTGIGSSTALSSMGRKLLKNMGITYLFAALVFTGLSMLLYPFSAGDGTGTGAVKELIQLIVDIVPDNLVECFVEDNDLQVIVIAIFAGVVLLALGARVSAVTHALSVLNDIVSKMMEFVCRALPFIVYLGIVRMMISKSSGLGELYKVAVVLIAAVLVVAIGITVRVRIRFKVPLHIIIRKQLPTLILSLTTGSQVSSLADNMKCCKEGFGVDEKFVNFALPLELVTYMPASAIFLGATAWGIMTLSGSVLDPTGIISVAIVAVIVAVAAPPIPGSVFAVMPIMFSTCGISMDYYSVAVICGTVLGSIIPVMNNYFLQLEILLTADELHMVDREKLAVPMAKSED